MTVRARRAVLVLGCGAVSVACSGGSGAAPSRPATPSATVGSTAPAAPASSPSASAASLPVVASLPPDVAGALPTLPATIGTGDPCRGASTPFTAASAYVAVAQLGQAAVAQLCVRGGAVSPSVTAQLRASSVNRYFVPAGPTTGSTITFRRIDGSQTITVTVAKADPGYAVTRVGTG